MNRSACRSYFTLFLGAGLLAAWLLTAAPPAPAAPPESAAAAQAPGAFVARSTFSTIGKTRLLHVWGAPREMGREVGRVLGAEIRLLYNDYLGRFVPFASERKALQAKALEMVPFLPADSLEEIRGVAEGAGMRFEEMLLGNCFLDLKRSPLCSTFVAYGPATRDGDVLFGRNLDFPSLGIAGDHGLVTVYHPTGKKAFVSVGWPGLSGVLSGMNEDGLSLAVMNVFMEKETPKGTPYTLLFREILENARTTDEAIARMQVARRTVGNNLMLCDARPSAALVEFSAEVCNVRRPVEDAIYSTNHFRIGESLAKTTCWRYPILERELRGRYGKLDVEGAKAVLGSVGLRLINLQAMLFRPVQRDLWVSFASPLASLGPYEHVPAERLWRAEAPPRTDESAGMVPGPLER
ncbi:MAG: hypothetical protein HYZ53_17765 [Planctomycetes bacterium]|nr:hypothetical protein [Planctomycetota bacterium]